MSRKKIACLFPGIGYTCDKPLLYYSWKLLKEMEWKVVPVQYSGFPAGVKGNQEKMEQAAQIALQQAEELLRETDWNAYTDILLIGKSVGTVVSSIYARRHCLPCRQVLFTPVETTFRYTGIQSVVFHGTADPWADTKRIEENCRKMGIPLYETEGANHALETGDVEKDLEILKATMKAVREYAEND